MTVSRQDALPDRRVQPKHASAVADERVAVLPHHVVVIPLGIQVGDDILLPLLIQGVFLVPEPAGPRKDALFEPQELLLVFDDQHPRHGSPDLRPVFSGAGPALSS